MKFWFLTAITKYVNFWNDKGFVINQLIMIVMHFGGEKQAHTLSPLCLPLDQPSY
jgi:hypothetical protein